MSNQEPKIILLVPELQLTLCELIGNIGDVPQVGEILAFLKDISLRNIRPIPFGNTRHSEEENTKLRKLFSEGEDGDKAYDLSLRLSSRFEDIIQTINTLGQSSKHLN